MAPKHSAGSGIYYRQVCTGYGTNIQLAKDQNPERWTQESKANGKYRTDTLNQRQIHSSYRSVHRWLFRRNAASSSQLDIVILMYDHDANCHLIDYRSQMSRRIVRSITEGEVIALRNSFDLASAVSRSREMIFWKKLYVLMYTDSKKLLEAHVKGKLMTEKD